MINKSIPTNLRDLIPPKKEKKNIGFPPIAPKTKALIDKLEWSDDEEDTEEKRIQKYKLPIIKISVDEETKNKMLIERQEMVDEPSVTSPEKLFDHKRSHFNGEVKIKENVEKQRNTKYKELQILPAATKKENLIVIPKIYPNISKEFEGKFDVHFLNKLWENCLDIGAESSLGLIPITKNLLNRVLNWVDEQTLLKLSNETYNDILKSYELNDFIEFSAFLSYLVQFYSKQFSSRISILENNLTQPDPFAPHPATNIIPIHCCIHEGCKVCTSLNVPQQHHVKPRRRNGKEEEKGNQNEVEGDQEDGEGEEEDDDDEEEEEDFTKEELFRIETVFRKFQYSFHGQLKKKDIFPMIQETLIIIDKKKIPQDFWHLSTELSLPNIDEFKYYIKLFRKDKEINYQELEVDKILRYSLPSWLKMEFKISEILLYQHLFSLIDIDGGGSIDASELQTLFASIGTIISLEEAEAVVAEYDLDGGGTIDFTEFMILIYKIQRGTINLKNNNLAQVILESKSQIKIFEEIEEVHSNPPLYCSIGHYGGSPIVCECHIIGPPSTPYENKKITIELTIFDGYPYHHPELKIMSNRILHMNIMNQLTGFSRLLHFHEVWKSDWKINTLLQHLIDLLKEPCIDYLPENFQEIYLEWNKAWQKIQQQQQRESERPSSAGQTTKIMKIEDLSNEKVLKMIGKCNRIEQMHLQILFLYLTNYSGFCEQVRKNLPDANAES